jgi:4-azaleucine resistance transporter AzlC
VKAAAPIVLGYFPIGVAYGVLGRAAGVPVWVLVLMSVIVFAGSAQLMAVSVLAQGAAPWSLVALAFLVNSRHVLYSTAVAPLLAKLRRGRLAWVAAELTDETFVVAAGAADGRPRVLQFPFVAGLNGTAHIAWVMGSLVGGVGGSLVGDPTRLGLDFALVAMFLGLLSMQVRTVKSVAVAALAGGLSLCFHLLGLGSGGVILATVLASAVGLAFTLRRAKEAG